MEDYDQRIAEGKTVSHLFRKKESKHKLLARNFNVPEAVHWVPIVKKFKAKVYEGRWGSSCYTSVAFRQLHRGARQFWCIERYTRGGQYKP